MIAAAATLLASHSDLLVRHLRRYAELAQAESELAARDWLTRAVWTAAALVCGIVALTLAGTAVMLAAVSMPASTAGIVALWVVPAVPAMVALAAVARARRANPPPFAILKQQLARDLSLIDGETKAQPDDH